MAKKALVIENDATIRECVEVMLEAEGLDVISARAGEAGLDLARQHQPHLIICDLYLSALSGIDILEALRADPALQHIPFLFITADSRDSIRTRCMALGADGFLLKPFTFDQLLEATRALIAVEP